MIQGKLCDGNGSLLSEHSGQGSRRSSVGSKEEIEGPSQQPTQVLGTYNTETA